MRVVERVAATKQSNARPTDTNASRRRWPDRVARAPRAAWLDVGPASAAAQLRNMEIQRSIVAPGKSHRAFPTLAPLAASRVKSIARWRRGRARRALCFYLPGARSGQIVVQPRGTRRSGANVPQARREPVPRPRRAAPIRPRIAIDAPVAAGEEVIAADRPSRPIARWCNARVAVAVKVARTVVDVDPRERDVAAAEPMPVAIPAGPPEAVPRWSRTNHPGPVVSDPNPPASVQMSK